MSISVELVHATEEMESVADSAEDSTVDVTGGLVVGLQQIG